MSANHRCKLWQSVRQDSMDEAELTALFEGCVAELETTVFDNDHSPSIGSF
ncbi:MAG: hypothetical protein GY796_10565 [Chloroflexi bacterium]|nr:hypothetical protein [Chloroflexota bacterium]